MPFNVIPTGIFLCTVQSSEKKKVWNGFYFLICGEITVYHAENCIINRWSSIYILPVHFVPSQTSPDFLSLSSIYNLSPLTRTFPQTAKNTIKTSYGFCWSTINKGVKKVFEGKDFCYQLIAENILDTAMIKCRYLMAKIEGNTILGKYIFGKILRNV